MFSNSIVALVTPFRNSLVDYDALEKIINWQISEGTDAILICGSTGEGLLLSMKEREEIIKKSIEISNKRVPIIVGCSSCWTQDAINLTKQAENLGADGVLLIAPYYVKPTQLGIIEHFAKVHDVTNIPIIAYNNPGRCAVDMSCDTVIELAKMKRIVALKDSNIDLSRVFFIKAKVPNFVMLSGDDPSFPGYLAHGGDGCISVTTNVAPKLVKNLINAWKVRDLNKVKEIGMKLAPLSSALFKEPNPIPVKYALSKMGFMNNELRSPLTSASVNTIKTLDNVLKKIL